MKKINFISLGLSGNNLLSSEEKKQLIGGVSMVDCLPSVRCDCRRVGGPIGYDSIPGCISKGCQVLDPYHADCKNQW